MKINKLFLTIVIALISPITILAYDFEVDGIYYNITDESARTVEVTRSYSNKYTGIVTIPSSVTYSGTTYSVTEIDYNTFYYCDLTSVTIGNSITSIGSEAFYGCWGLTSITIPNSVTEIGENAFYGCTGLTEVTIGNSITSIGNNAFDDCYNLSLVNILDLSAWCNIDFGNFLANPLFFANELKLNGSKIKDLVIPNDITRIKNHAFDGYSRLTSVTIPNSVTSIGESAFSGCSGLTSITIPNSVTEIGNYAFYGCTGLTSITIPNSVTSIGNYAFKGCENLKVVINLSNLTFTKDSSNYGYIAYYANQVINDPKASIVDDFVFSKADNVNRLVAYLGNETKLILPTDFNGGNYDIGSSAFSNYSGLTSITIPNSVTEIGEEAFYGCSGLTSVTIPNFVTSIGRSAFEKCTGLTEVNISDLSAWCNISFGGDYANPLFFANELKLNGSKIKDLVIPNDITKIKDYAFNGCSGLASITIPNSVTRIGDHAFSKCYGLTSVTIPNSVTEIGGDAFCWCTGLTSVTIPNSVTEIGNYAFYGCTGLTSITIPNSVTEIGSSAFSNCSGLTNITVDSGNTKYDSRNNCNAIIETATNTLLYGCKSSNIPKSVTSIGNYAFYDCNGLISITIPNSVTEIGSSAFDGCYNLKLVINLSNLTFSKGSSSYGYIAYYANQVINVINNSNSSIVDDFVFYRKADNVNRLVAYFGNETKLILPTDFNGENYEIDDYAFYSCTGLTSVTIGNSVTEIGDYAFYGCTGLTEITVDSDNAKYDSRDNCNAIIETTTNTLIYGCKSSNIPNSVTSIGASAFYDCTGLTEVNIPNSVTSIGNYAFKGCTGLTSVTIPYSVTEIDNYAFNGCTGLAKLTIEDGTKTLSLGYNYYNNSSNYYNYTGHGLFYDCPLDTLYLGRNISYDTDEEHGYSPFYEKTTLKSVTIGKSVTEIGHYAFDECSKLTSITIPNSVTKIGLYAFYNTAWYKNQPDGVIYAGRVLYKYKGTMPNNTSIDIKEETVSISPWAFSGCSGLTEVTIPNSVTEIGDGAFSGCSGFTKLTIENGTKTLSLGYIESNSSGIGKGLFYGCPLKSLYLGRNLSYNTSIEYGYSPFYKNTKLETITIGNSVTKIKGLAFLGCTGLKKLTFEDGTKTLLLGNNYQYNDSKTNQGLFNDCSLESIYIGRDIDYTTNYNGNYDISFSPFAFQSRLKSVTIGNTVSYIASELFYYCEKLYNVIIGNSVNRIGSSAFAYCRNLREIIIPNSVTEFGNNAFRYCSGLTHVWFNAENCSSMRDLNVFAECPNLYDISFGDNVRNIPDYAFMDCNSLSKIAIGKSVTNIGYKAFFDCGLSEITSYCMTPPTCSISFSGGTHSALESRKDSYSASLYVPEGTKDTYATAPEWKEFKNIQEIAGVEDVMIDNVAVKIAIENGNISINGIENPQIEIYNLNGKCLYSGNDTSIPVSGTGIYILRINGKSYKIVNN